MLQQQRELGRVAYAGAFFSLTGWVSLSRTLHFAAFWSRLLVVVSFASAHLCTMALHTTTKGLEYDTDNVLLCIKQCTKQQLPVVLQQRE